MRPTWSEIEAMETAKARAVLEALPPLDDGAGAKMSAFVDGLAGTKGHA